MAYPERRNVQRLQFPDSVKGRLSGMRVSILDLSTTGARVEHSFPLAAGRRLNLEFPWRDESISLQCDVVRCTTHRGGSIATANAYTSGLRFCEPPGPARATLARMLAELVSRDMNRLRDQLTR